MAVDPNDIQWDDSPSSAPAQAQVPAQAPAPAPSPAAPKAAPTSDDIQWDGPPVGQPTNPAAQPAPAQGQTQPQDTDYQHKIAIIRGMLASDAPREKVKAAIMDYASANNLVGSNFENDIDAALSYRDRAGHKAAAHDTVFENVKPEDPNEPITITGQRPKPRPNGISQNEATVVGALESVPGADRIGAAVDAGLNELNPYSKEGFSEHYNKTLEDNRALSDQAWNEQPGSYGYGYALGMAPQMLIGTGEVDAAAHAPSLIGTMARGAAYGGGASLANTRQDLSTGEGWQNAGEHAVIDAGMGAGLGAAVHGATALTSRGYSAEGRNILDAADRLSRDGSKVEPTVQQTGGVFSQAANAGFRNMPFIGAPTQRRAETFVDQTHGAFNRTADDAAGGTAVPMTDTAKGLLDPNVQGSLANYEPTAKAALKPEYDSIDQQAANVMVKPVKTLDYLDNAIAQQKARFRGDKADWLPVIEDVRNDVAKGDIPFSSLRDYRTSIRDELQQRLGDGWRNMAPAARRNVEGVLDGIYKNATDDIHQALRVNGLRDASKALKGVDAQYAQVSNTAKALQPLLALPPEQLAPKLEQLAQDRGGDAGKLSEVMRTLSPQQQQQLQGSFVHTLGQSTAGKATADDAFSLESFLTRWGGDGSRGGMSNDAKNLLFTGQTRRDLDDLVTLARSQRRYYQKFGNPSGTAKTAIGVAELLSGGGALVSGAALHPSAWLPVIGSYVTAHMIAAPGFARALVNLGEKGSKYVPMFTRRLEVLARRNPNAATQFLGLRDAIMGNQHANSVQTGAPQKPAGGDNFDYWLSQVPDEPAPPQEPDTEEPAQPDAEVQQ